MLDYLKQFNLKNEDISEIKKMFNKDIISKFEVMENNVVLILNYLKEIGVINFKDLILYRPDICFMNIQYLKGKIEKLDSKLVKFVIENDIDNLINFDI